MTSEERTKRKFEQGTGSEKTRKKIELMNDLTSSGVVFQGNQKLNKASLQEMATLKNVDLDLTEEIRTEGWMGKLKGLEQVLWERGWIDEKIRGGYRKIKKMMMEKSLRSTHLRSLWSLVLILLMKFRNCKPSGKLLIAVYSQLLSSMHRLQVKDLSTHGFFQRIGTVASPSRKKEKKKHFKNW